MSVVRRVSNIIKSSLDKREYRGVELSNGLRALLVSDTTTDKSAASMNVAAGHLMDPWEMPGTAHFCEHMLFMGTEKYPCENDYGKFISENAGMSNAYTSSDHTCYYFDIKPEAFKGAIDRFVQFFLTPKFTASSTEREVLAVDSEHKKNLKQDSWRVMQVERSLSKPGHDCGKFGTGDKTTLGEAAIAKGLDPRQTLLNFHKKWYSSSIMSCILFGKESLDELENYLLTMGFADIPNNGAELYYWIETPFGPSELNRKVTVVPIKEMRQMRISFPVPYLKNEYKSSPGLYLSHLIGHEGKGSLLSEIKRRGLATGLHSGPGYRARGIATFDISVQLTEEGTRRVEEIAELIFQYIGMIRKTGIQQWIFDEQSTIDKIDFEFRDKTRPASLVQAYVTRLIECPFEDILTYQSILSEYKPDLIERVLNCLTPDNCYYLVVDKSIAGKEGNTFEPIYGTEMRIDAVSAEQLARYKGALNTPNPDVFHMPEPNQYIPTDLSLREEKAKSDVPQVVMDTQWIRVWHKKDEEYNLPKAIISVRVHSPAIRKSPRNEALLHLYALLFGNSLTEQIYDPELAGLQKTFEEDLASFNLEVNGYNEKQALYLQFLLKHLLNFVPDQSNFDIMLKELQRAYRNSEYNHPTTLAAECLRRFLSSHRWTDEQKLAESETFKIEDVLQFRQDLFAAFHIELVAHGNVTEKETIDLANSVVEILTTAGNCRPLYANEYWMNREVELPLGTELVHHHHKNSHEVSCVEAWFQLGVMNTELQAMNSLLAHIMHEPAFDQLRTKETLGYVVYSGAKNSHGTTAIRLIVQGAHEPQFVRSRIHVFLEQMREKLVEMSEEDFEKQKAGAITALLIQPKTLDGRNMRFTTQITSKVYDFKKCDNLAEFLRSVQKKDLIDFFDRKISKNAEERRLMTIFVHSHGKGEEEATNKQTPEEYEVVECPYSLRSSLGLYPRAKPHLSLPPIGISPMGPKRSVEKAHI